MVKSICMKCSLILNYEEEKVMKVRIIRCMQTEDYCPGTADFNAIKNRTGIFEGIEDEIEIVGFINCEGCPGKSQYFVQES